MQLQRDSKLCISNVVLSTPIPIFCNSSYGTLVHNVKHIEANIINKMELGMSCCRGIRQAIHTYPFLPNKVHLCFYNLIPLHTYTQHHVITTSNSMNIKQECSDV